MNHALCGWRVIVLCCCLAGQAMAADYYLSATGNDGNAGSAAQPWRSLSKVNSLNLQPGDRVFLRGGDSFSGSLQLRAADAGNGDNPVVFTSYGTGRAIIAPPANEHGFDIYNTAGISISELIIDGGNLSTHNKCGIQAYLDLAGDDTRLDHISVSDCEIRNVQHGVSIGAWGSGNTYSGFSNVTLERLVVHDVEGDGITSWGMYPGSATKQSHRNIVVRDCEVYGVTGDPDKTDGHSGSGIILSGTNGGLIEGCYAHHNGGGGGRPSGGGPVGIWCWDAVAVTIRGCLVHDQRTISGAVDGGGFDLDGGAIDCTIEYCYSYDNHGPGILVAEFVGAGPLRNNTVRYNVSYNDGQANGMGGIHFWNGKSDASLCENIVFHNNLIVQGPDSTGPVIRYQSGGMRGMQFINNSFVTQRGLDLVTITGNTGAFSFAGNNWYATDGNHDYRWGGTTYDSLAAWRAASGNPETHDGADCGRQGDPGLVNLAQMPRPTSIAALAGLDNLRLAAGSACIDAGFDLQADFTIDPGTRDLFGTSLKQGTGYDIGPHEAEASAPSAPELQLSTTTLSVNEGGTATFQVRLTAQPSGTVAVTVGRSAGDGNITVNSGSSLSFTTSTWQDWQTVRLAAAQDGDTSAGTATITVSASGLASVTLSAVEVDNDTTLTVAAGSGGSVSPSGATVVTIGGNRSISADPDPGYHFSAWSVTSGSASFANASLAATTVSIDAPATIRAQFAANAVAIEADVGSLSVDEGGTASFQVRLTAQPSGTVAVTAARSAGDSDITVSAGSSLSFTTSTWQDWQTVQLAAAQDDDVLDGTATIRLSAAGLSAVSLTITETDDDTLPDDRRRLRIRIDGAASQVFEIIEPAGLPAGETTGAETVFDDLDSSVDHRLMAQPGGAG